MKRIYLDNAATTAPYPAVLAAMTDTAQRFYGNPSSLPQRGAGRAEAAERLPRPYGRPARLRAGRAVLHLRRQRGGQLGHPRTGAGGREKGKAPHRHLRV